MSEPMTEDKKNKRPRGTVSIDVDLCKGCGFCIAFCPSAVLEFSGKFNSKGYHPPRAVNPDACIGCDMCGMYCPDFAIFGARAAKTGA